MPTTRSGAVLNDYFQDSASDTKRRIWRLDLVSLVILYTRNKPVRPTTRTNDNLSSPFVRIVYEFIKPNL